MGLNLVFSSSNNNDEKQSKNVQFHANFLQLKWGEEARFEINNFQVHKPSTLFLAAALPYFFPFAVRQDLKHRGEEEQENGEEDRVAVGTKNVL